MATGQPCLMWSNKFSLCDGNVNLMKLAFWELIHRPVSDSISVFVTGIPYAEPPIESFRFAPPRSPRPWRGVRHVQDFAPVCPQVLPSLHDDVKPDRYEYLEKRRLYLRNQSEDCLYLNIYAPHQPEGEWVSERKCKVPISPVWLSRQVVTFMTFWEYQVWISLGLRNFGDFRDLINLKPNEPNNLLSTFGYLRVKQNLINLILSDYYQMCRKFLIFTINNFSSHSRDRLEIKFYLISYLVWVMTNAIWIENLPFDLDIEYYTGHKEFRCPSFKDVPGIENAVVSV